MATAHVVPIADRFEHLLDSGCLCGPWTETVEDDTGRTAGFVVVHASLDGREHRENRWWRHALRRAGFGRACWAVIRESEH